MDLLCVCLVVCVTVTAGDECCNPAALKGETDRAFCKGRVHFVLTHTLNVVNDLPHDNCTNKPFWPGMPVSVRAWLDAANLNIGLHRTVCLLRIVTPRQ